MNVALIFAGGTGKRMNTKGKPKQFLELNGKPIIIHTIEKFEEHPEIDFICVVCVADWIPVLRQYISKFNIKKVRWIVKGGQSGEESIRNGLFTIYDDVDGSKECLDKSIVLIHDGVRPLIDEHTISMNIDAVKKYSSAITVIPATETIAVVADSGEINDIIKREECRLARAPQSFYLKDIVNAHKKAVEEHAPEMVDSAMLMKYYGMQLHTVDGPVENIKITNPSDFYVFRAILEAKENSQIWGL